ncbi:MAG: hypothetical protein EBS77_08720 [Gammaproteobacteria bacterium]|nr:hypothetical protein [Gammaproteobacteria bacterium]
MCALARPTAADGSKGCRHGCLAMSNKPLRTEYGEIHLLDLATGFENVGRLHRFMSDLCQWISRQ